MAATDTNLDPDVVPRGGSCPTCGWRRPPHVAGDRCRACGFEAAPATVVREGWDAAGGGPAIAALAWSAPVIGTALLDQGWLSLSLGGAMGAHVTRRAVAGPPRARLVVSRSGVAVLRRRRAPRFTRWHLFDQARLEAIADDPGQPAAEGPPAWKLILVNAYKPSISTYLHRRGTDAAIFAPCVEFAFRALPAEAESLRIRAARQITVARARYRALRLKQMEEAPLDTAALLSLQRCPSCDAALPGPGAAARCGSCGARYQPDAFVVADAVLSPAWLGPLAAFLGLLAAPALLIISSAGAAATAVAVATAGLVLAGLRRRRGAPRVIAAGDRIELWHGEAPAATLPLAELAELRAIRLESGCWRLAAWRAPRDWTHYSELLFCWVSLPPGRPALDLLVRGDARVAALQCTEIERRWRGCRGEVDPRLLAAP